ncbi:helix-turn-helix transcriptional regulator [Pseudoalteromonas sp. McH1-7]|uniref:helix-turn-helix domain-containing protein n=2 Tax=unclassified Pseudoalteromonas TaxID=194690 RepID=UPI0015907373|nr:helix-turn-helix transcriptional regulator [Pseudoalteromonas sp. McH1-7]MBD1583479.1 helix-turn-helix transcriptional regulator [Pseudoalteromonas sp. S16_S37]NUZ10034.1 helix-turn-helix transcriptional regulator [Pseudoalteromonas sp. McH1-7]
MMTGGQVIKVARTFRAMSQEDVARIYGVSPRTVQRWESDKGKLPFDTVSAIVEQVCQLSLIQVLQVGK